MVLVLDTSGSMATADVRAEPLLPRPPGAPAAHRAPRGRPLRPRRLRGRGLPARPAHARRRRARPLPRDRRARDRARARHVARRRPREGARGLRGQGAAQQGRWCSSPTARTSRARSRRRCAARRRRASSSTRWASAPRRGQPVPELDAEGRVTGYKRDESGSAVVSRLNLATLEAIARGTGGKAFRITPADTSLVRPRLRASRAWSRRRSPASTRTAARSASRCRSRVGLACLALGLLLPPPPLRRAAAAALASRTRARQAALLLLASSRWPAPARAQAPSPPAPAPRRPRRRRGPARAGRVLDEVLLRPRRATEEGRGEYARGNHPQALSAFERAAAARPQDPAVRFNVADGLYKNGKYDEAAALFRALGADAGLAARGGLPLQPRQQPLPEAGLPRRDPGLPRRPARGRPATRTRAATSRWRCARSRSRKSSRSSSRSSSRRTTRTSRTRTRPEQQQDQKGNGPEGPGQAASRTSRRRTSRPADAAGAGRPALPAGGGHAAGAGDAAARRPAAEREGRAEEAPGPEARAEEEGEGLVSVRARRPGRAARSLAALCSCAPPAAARASFTLRSEVDARKIGVQDQVQLTHHRRGQRRARRDPAARRSSNLDVVAGPSQSTQVSIVNGRMSQSRSPTYVLQPRAVGKAEVGARAAGDQVGAGDPDRGGRRQRPPARAAAPGPVRHGPLRRPLRGDVRPAARPRGRAAAPRGGAALADPAARRRAARAHLLALHADLRHRPPVQGRAPVRRLLGRGPRAAAGLALGRGGDGRGRELPALPDPAQAPLPDEGGTLTIPAATFRIGLARQGFFDSGGAWSARRSPSRSTVEPLPDAAGFSGAVGRFRASASLDRDVVPLGEAATLRFRVEGTGNLKWIERGPEVAANGREGLPAAGEERPAHDGRRASPARARGSSWWCPRRAARSRCRRSPSRTSIPRPGGS